MSNRWYAPALRVRKSSQSAKWRTNFLGDGSGLFLFPSVTCVKESANQPNGFLECRRKSQPSPFQKVKA